MGKSSVAWPPAEKDLGRVLADLLVTADRRSLTGAEAAAEDSLKNELSQCERKLSAYRKAARKDATPEVSADIEAARLDLLSAEAAWSAFQLEMGRKYPVTEGEAYSLEQIQGVLQVSCGIVQHQEFNRNLNRVVIWTSVFAINVYHHPLSGHQRIRLFLQAIPNFYLTSFSSVITWSTANRG